jgi:hypothetical protein
MKMDGFRMNLLFGTLTLDAPYSAVNCAAIQGDSARDRTFRRLETQVVSDKLKTNIDHLRIQENFADPAMRTMPASV